MVSKFKELFYINKTRHLAKRANHRGYPVKNI